MKTYEPRRNNACPNGLHADYNPALDPSLNECTCPWLIIQSSTPVQHITSWNRRETENVIREMDRGYFDPPGYPKRSGSMFLAPAMQRLIDVAEKEPVAAALTLLAGAGSGLPPFDAIAWDAEDACLSLRVPGLGWRRLWLGHANVDAMTDSDFTTAGGANPVLLWADHPDTAEDTSLPEALIATPHDPCACDAPGTCTLDECTCDLNTREQCAPCATAVSGDVYAEDLDEYAPQNQPTAAQVLDAMSQEADDVAADSATARIMGDYMPLMLTVPADEIPNLKPGNPIFDEAMRQAEAANAGVMFLPEEFTFPPSYGTCTICLHLIVDEQDVPVHRICLPLPRRVPQVPSEIDFATLGAPVVGEDGYEIPPLCLNDEHPEGHFSCRRTAGHEDMHRDGSVRWGIL